ncbi:MAG: beta-ketoacyl synthase [Desulfobulbaceae bacterium]|nr:beta-ketoacyl synthase [Desulfobulbaceae bacterium]
MTDHNGQKPVIAGYEILTALGDLNATWEGLMAGQSSLQPVMLPHVPTNYPVGRITGLGQEYGSARRVAELLQRGLAHFFKRHDLPEPCDIVIATTKGAADELLLHADDPEGQPWHIAGMTAEIAGCKDMRQTVSAACASGTVALIQAARQIKTEISECILIVGVDVLSSFVMTGFDVLKALSPGPCTPFDKNRNGLSLGEGMGVVIMCSESYAAAHQLQVQATIESWGISCDATHITAPSRSGSGLIRVVEQATRNKTIPVGAINAHGTGTVYNDAMEMTAFHACWDHQPPFHSVKGAIGHCLGAAGVIEAAIALRSLERGIIPPSVGYREGEAPAGTISGSSSQPLFFPTILACNSGFGGINAGIIFAKP